MSIDLATRISRHFDQAWRESGAVPELAGVAVAVACHRELSVAGVGLSLLRPPWRAPIGASDSAVVTAECRQFTLGHGPCSLAHERQHPVRATTAVLHRHWPALARELIDHTPYRAVLAVPLTGWLAGMGTMSVYFRDDDAMTDLDPDDLDPVLDTIALLLAGALGPHSDHPWLMDAPNNRIRHQTVVAIGMLVARLTLSFPDALDILRGYALRTGRDVDDIAADLIDGALDGGDLAAEVHRSCPRARTDITACIPVAVAGP